MKIQNVMEISAKFTIILSTSCSTEELQIIGCIFLSQYVKSEISNTD